MTGKVYNAQTYQSLSNPHHHNKKTFSFLILCFCISLQISSGFCQDVTKPERKTAEENSQHEKGSQVRISRSAPSSSGNDASSPVSDENSKGPYNNQGRLFPPPTLKNKYQNRVARFHGGSNIPRFHGGSSNSGYYNSPVARMFVNQNTPGGDLSRQLEGEDENGQRAQVDNLMEQDPTFTPYISARALSNIPKFFEHLRANLEALQMNDDEFPSEELESDQMEEGDGGFGLSNIDPSGTANGDIMDGNYPEPKIARWIPSSMGGLRSRGGPNMRNFVQNPSLLESIYRGQSGYNPARNAYEFGLGKK